MRTQERIKNIERQLETLWKVIEDDRLWHPSIIQELQRRSRGARRDHSSRRLRSAAEVLSARRR